MDKKAKRVIHPVYGEVYLAPGSKGYELLQQRASKKISSYDELPKDVRQELFSSIEAAIPPSLKQAKPEKVNYPGFVFHRALGVLPSEECQKDFFDYALQHVADFGALPVEIIYTDPKRKFDFTFTYDQYLSMFTDAQCRELSDMLDTESE